MTGERLEENERREVRGELQEQGQKKNVRREVGGVVGKGLRPDEWVIG